MFKKIKNWLDQLYLELTSTEDTPQHIALSFAIGVFLGILPFTGVLAAIAVAVIFRLNKPAAIVGSAITNTWLGLIVLGFAVQTGAFVLGMDSTQILEKVNALTSHFHWKDLFSSSIFMLLMPLSLGYLILSFILSVFSYFLVLGLIFWHKGRG